MIPVRAKIKLMALDNLVISFARRKRSTSPSLGILILFMVDMIEINSLFMTTLSVGF